MSLHDIGAELRANTYPGRGIILGKAEDGERHFIAYFIMGRSENSRNRIFAETEDGIRTKAFDPAKLTDPSLVIYHPVRFLDGCAIVTNGNQTDTIRDHLQSGSDFYRALETREFEPDPPNYTPRISGIINSDGSYKLSILKSNCGDPSCCCRYFFDYDNPAPGTGHFISTYKSDGNPLPSFEGEPLPVSITGTLREYADMLWASLNEENKVSLYACEVDIKTGAREYLIINKHTEE